MDPNEPTKPIRPEELVAYLDGELDDEAARRVEALIQSDEAVREELHRLERAWEALNALPRSEADEKLTKSTVEMAVVEAEGEVKQQVVLQTKQKLLWWSVAAISLMAAGFVGTLAVGALWPDPNQELLRNYPVVRNLDQYQQADNLQFLRQLRDKKLFMEEPSEPKEPEKKDPERTEEPTNNGNKG